jgi:type IV pilus assembly protein PilY1
MKSFMKNLRLFALICAAGIACLSAANAAAQAATRPDQVPLFLTASAPPAVLLNMSRDHKLFYEAYNDASDINGDGTIDVGFKPGEITYFGLFDSFKCYRYGNNRFEPVSTTATKQCSGQWSGDFLNYITTTRIDALRRVLYGGMRAVDSATETVLERAFIPQDAHAFGKEYRNLNLSKSGAATYDAMASNGYDISKYTPYAVPGNGETILFASVTLFGTNPPLLRVMTGRSFRVWEWLSKESPVADSDLGGTIADFTVRVQVCVSGLLEQDCRGYPSSAPTVYKPSGVLQEFGEGGQMRFGLMSGSYDRNLSGGVLRKNIGNFGDEIDLDTGQFKAEAPLVQTFNALRVQGFGKTGARHYECGWWIDTASDLAPDWARCSDWGNPVAEMMYEGLRYFAGKRSPTLAYAGGGDAKDSGLGLTRANWVDPYGAQGLPYCSKPVQMVISDSYVSYDGDELPGTSFGPGISEDLGGTSLNGAVTFNATSVANLLSTKENITGRFFVGESTADADVNKIGLASGKSVTGFASIRGLAPEEPTRKGTYYSAAVAHYGKTTDLRPDLKGVQNVDTYSIALASPLAKIQIPIGDKTITLIPTGQTVSAGSSRNPQAVLPYTPANQIVDFYIDTVVNALGFYRDATVNDGRAYGKFRINFEDVEQGADHDMDAIAEYEYKVNSDNTVSITVTSTYASGSYVQHLGYVIEGTTSDNTYFVVRDLDTCNRAWDGPANEPCAENSNRDVTGPGDTPRITGRVGLPLTDTRTFQPRSGNGLDSARFIPQTPLWYAAKWGGYPDMRNTVTNENILSAPGDIGAFEDKNANLKRGAWDSLKIGQPDNFFLVNDAALLREQMRRAFLSIQNQTGTAAGVANGSTGLTADSWSYMATFRSTDWSGEVKGSRISTAGVISSPVWTTDTTLSFTGNNWNTRRLLTWSPSRSSGVAGSANFFSTSGSNGIPAAQIPVLNLTNIYSTLSTIPSTAWSTLTSAQRQAKALEVLVNYIAGDKTYERVNGGTLRDRQRLMGDVVNSSIAVTGNFNYGFSSLPGDEGTSYAAWLNYKRTTPSYRTAYVGANDGMLHAFDGATGEERFAYVPNGVYSKLINLLEAGKPHEYFVDGKIAISDAYRSNKWTTVLVGSTGAGGRSVFALDVGNPTGELANVLWEFRDPDLGYTLGKPIIARTAGTNGKWAVFISNGYYSKSGLVKLFVLDLFTGSEIANYTFSSEGQSADNGMGALGALVDEGIVKSVFGGDLQGNLWGLDTSSSSISKWKPVGTGSPAFVAKDADGKRQPITAAPSVSAFVGGGVQLFFGTGRLLVQADRSTEQQHSFYALQIPDTANWAGGNQRDQLVKIPLTESGNLRFLERVSFPGTQIGWFYDLPTPIRNVGSERYLSEAKYGLGYVDVNTWAPPSEACAPGGTSWGLAANALTGYVTEAQVDVNKDGIVDAWEGKGQKGTYASGSMLLAGTVAAPAINLTLGSSSTESTGKTVLSSDSCAAGEVGISVPGQNDIKICRKDNPAVNGCTPCPPNYKVVTDSSNTGSPTCRCIPVFQGRQSWFQLQ